MRDMQAGMNFDAEGAQAATAFVLCSFASLGKSVTYHHVVSVWQMMMRFHAVEVWRRGGAAPSRAQWARRCRKGAHKI